MYQRILTSFLILATVATIISPVALTPRVAQAGVLEDLANKLKNALEEVPSTSQQVLIKMLDGIDVFLNASKVQVGAKLLWTADQRTKANAKLDEGLKKTADLRTKANAVDLTSANALADLKAIYDEGKTWWSAYQIELKTTWAEILIENGNRTIAAADAVEGKINAIADTLKEGQIVDTSTLKSLITQLSAEIEESKQNIVIATSYVEKMKASTKVVEAGKYYVSARLEVSKANTNLLGDGSNVVNQIMTEIQRLATEIKNK
jgi:hypothetical protein